MTRTPEALLPELAVLLRTFGAKDVFVFGSYAGGTQRPDSDFDIAVSGIPPALFYRAAAAATDLAERPVDLLDLDDNHPKILHLKASGELRRVA